MKKITPLALMAMCLMLFACVRVSTRPEKATQVKQVNQVIALEQFDKITITDAMQVTYETGDSCSVMVNAPKDVFEQLVIYVDRGYLCIDTKRQSSIGSMLLDMSQAKIHVTCPTLKSIEVTGSGSFVCDRPVTTDNLKVGLTGSGTINLTNLTCDKVDTDLTGSGVVTFGTLNVKCVESDVTGSGSIVYSDLHSDYAESKVTGSGNVSLTGSVSKHDESVTGSGSIETSGLK